MDPGLIPGWETKVSWVMEQKEKKKVRKEGYMLCNNSEKNLKIIMLKEINQTKDYILYDSIYMKGIERQNCKQRTNHRLPGAYLGWEWGCLKYTGGNFGGRQKHSNSGCEAACTLVHIYCLAVHLHWVICMICKLYSNKAIKMHQGINKICEVLYMFTIVGKKKAYLKNK